MTDCTRNRTRAAVCVALITFATACTTAPSSPPNAPPANPQQPGYPPQGYQQQAYPPQGYPQQAYPQQAAQPESHVIRDLFASTIAAVLQTTTMGIAGGLTGGIMNWFAAKTSQHNAQNGYASTYGAQYPNNGYGASSGNGASAYPPSSYPSSTYPNSSYPSSTYPNTASTYPNTASTYPNGTSTYPNTASTYPNGTSTYPNTASTYPNSTSTYPSSSYPSSQYPANQYPQTAGTYPNSTYPSTSTYPDPNANAYPNQNPNSSYPSSSYPNSSYPNSSYPNSGYPQAQASSGYPQAQGYPQTQGYPQAQGYPPSGAPAYGGTGAYDASGGYASNGQMVASRDTGVYAGIAYEVHAFSADGHWTPVDPNTYAFKTGDRFMVYYRPSLPGRMQIYNINATGQQSLIDATDMAAGQLAGLGPYEFANQTGDESLRLVLSPCSTPQLLVATRDIVKVDTPPPTNADTGGGVHLENCSAVATRGLDVHARGINDVAADGLTSFALDAVSTRELATGDIQPRQVTIVFHHR